MAEQASLSNAVGGASKFKRARSDDDMVKKIKDDIEYHKNRLTFYFGVVDQSRVTKQIDHHLKQIDALEEKRLKVKTEAYRQVKFMKVGDIEYPSSFSQAASQVSRTSLDKRECKGDIYHHWLAVALYNLVQDLEELVESESVSLKFLDNPDVSIPQSELIQLLGVWSKLEGSEIYHSSVLACELDRFLFGKNPELGYCCHQMPVDEGSSPQTADFCIFPKGSSSNQYTFSAISVYKKNDFEKATIQSSVYSIVGKQTKTERASDVRLAFPLTHTSVALHLCVPVHGKQLRICVLQYEDASDSDKKKFLCALYAGVHYLNRKYLSKRNIRSRGYIAPTQDLQLQIIRKHYSVGIDSHKKYVYKFFDKSHTHPQAELAEAILKAELIDLTTDGYYKYLKYQYREGDHDCKSNAQIRQLLTQLDIIHSKGYVHSDIRCANLVFSSNETDAWIIDFDLAAAENQPYPEDFRDNLPERHEEAQAFMPRKKIHDVWSLAEAVGQRRIFTMFVKDKKTLLQIADEYC